MDSDEESLLLVLLLRRRRRCRRRRSLWMHPITSHRLLTGQYHTLIINELKADAEKFFNYCRMSKRSFEELYNILKEHIERADTNMRKSISAEERLMITLR